MTNSLLMLVLLAAAGMPAAEPGDVPDVTAGTIGGVVVDGSRGNEPLEGVDVLLRAGTDGKLVPVAETTTDRYGKFTFDHVPPDPELVYMVGANRDGVHYPAERLRLRPTAKVAYATIVAYAATEGPSPLVAERHDIKVHRQAQALEVTEELVVRNPSRRTYVGRPRADGSLATFSLAVPPQFDRVTFAQEFHGRRFKVIDHRLVTDLPWPPGQRTLQFSYHLPIDATHGVFERTLDVPCAQVRLLLVDDLGEQVTCSLPGAVRQPSSGAVLFASTGGELPAGHAVTLSVGRLPIPWRDYSHWGALTALGLLVVLTAALPRLRRSGRRPAPRQAGRRAA